MSDVSSSLWVGFAICSFSFLCIILMVYLDWRQDLLLEMKEIIDSNNSVTEHAEKKPFEMTQLSRMFYFLSIYCMLMYSGILPFNYIATSFLMNAW
jgi:hypothetical protein